MAAGAAFDIVGGKPTFAAGIANGRNAHLAGIRISRFDGRYEAGSMLAYFELSWLPSRSAIEISSSSQQIRV